MLRLHDNLAGHLWVDPTIEGVLSRFSEAELKLVVGIECRRLKLALGAINCMWDVVMIDPSHLRSNFHNEWRRTKDEVVDDDLSRRVCSCCPHGVDGGAIFRLCLRHAGSHDYGR